MTRVQVEKIKMQTLTWLKANHYKKIIVESDCLLMVSAFNKGVDYVSLVGLIIQEFIRLLEDILECPSVFVRRTGNQVAHHLANAAGSMSVHEECSYNWSALLLSVITKDFI